MNEHMKHCDYFLAQCLVKSLYCPHPASKLWLVPSSFKVFYENGEKPSLAVGRPVSETPLKNECGVHIYYLEQVDTDECMVWAYRKVSSRSPKEQSEKRIREPTCVELWRQLLHSEVRPWHISGALTESDLLLYENRYLAAWNGQCTGTWCCGSRKRMISSKFFLE